VRIERLPLLALIALSLIWGYSWIVMKIAMRHAGVFDFSLLRVVIGGLCLFIVLALSGRPLLPPPGRWREIFALGVVQTGIYIALSMWTLVEGAVGRTAVLIFTMPFWTLVLARLFLHERLRRTQWLAVGLSAAGLVIIIQPWSLGGSLASKLIAIVAGIDWAVSSIMVKRLQARGRIELLCLNAWQFLFGALPLLVIVFLVPAPPIDWSKEFILALTFSGIATTALGWWLWLYILKHLPAGIASMCTLMIPVIALLSSALQLGERPEIDELIGMGLIGLALLLLPLRLAD
jgi:drug/metabolite transporter (DMT)-like permease